MKILKKYLVIILILLALMILSNADRRKDNAGPCCPLSIMQDHLPEGANK